MTVTQVLDFFKTYKAVADACGITPGAVQRWRRENKIPYDRQCQIQVVTKNKLRAIKPHEAKSA